MAARRGSLQGFRLQDLCGLPPGWFQTPTERARLKAAVHQVFGGQPWEGCCSDKLLEVLLEAGQGSCLKQQLYWDFQFLDSDQDGYLSIQDAEFLLGRVPGAQATGEACRKYLWSRRPGVAWSDIEDWLFRAPQPPLEGAVTHSRRGFYTGQAASSRASPPLLHLWEERRQAEDPLERWDRGGLATLLGEQPSGTVAVLEQKYLMLQRKLCTEMLQAHYGQPIWASLPQNVKEVNLSELDMLVQFSLREGSILPLSSLPGALHCVRSGSQALKGDLSTGPHDPLIPEGTAAHALQRLQCKRQAEMQCLMMMPQRHGLVGSNNPEALRRLLHLHAQAELVRQEVSFPAALLAMELLAGESFWDSKPVTPGTSHRELARLRLAAGHGERLAWRKTETVPGQSMMQVLLDQLLVQQGRDRATLVHLLLTLEDPETVHERGCGQRQQWRPLGEGGQGEDVSPALQDVISQVLMLAKKQLQAVAQGTEVSWQDCAIAVLMDLQQEQQMELSQAIEGLSGITSGREGEACSVFYKSLLARLQEPPLMSWIQRLQPTSLQEQQQAGELLQGDQNVPPGQEALETILLEKPFQTHFLHFPLEETKKDIQEVLGRCSLTFPLSQKEQEEWEGMELHQSRKPEEAGPQTTVQCDAEKHDHPGAQQIKADQLDMQMPQIQKMHQVQGSPEPLQVPEKLKRETDEVTFEDVKDPQAIDAQDQKMLETPASQDNVFRQPGGLLLVPETQKQHETMVMFPQVQRGAQVEPEKASSHPQGIPRPSEMRKPKDLRTGVSGGLQDSWQEGPPGAMLKVQETPQVEKVLDSQGHSQEKLLRKSKSLVSFEFAMWQGLWPQGLKDLDIPMDPYGGILLPHPPKPQNKELGNLEPQIESEPQYLPQQEKVIIQGDEMEKAIDMGPQFSLKENQELPVTSAHGGPQIFALQDGEKRKILHIEGTQVPRSEEWREPEAIEHQIEDKTFQVHKDLQEKYLMPQISEMDSSETPYSQRKMVPELSQLQGVVLKKSKLLDIQGLSQASVREPWGSPWTQQKYVFPQGPHPQEQREAETWKDSQAEGDLLKGHSFKEVLEHEEFQSPGPLQKVSVLKESQEAQLWERHTPYHQEEGKTEVCLDLGDMGETQEHLERNLEKHQVNAQRKPETLSDLGRKAKILELEEMSRTQGVWQEGNILIPGMPQRIPLDQMQKRLDLPQRPLQGTPEAPQACKDLRTTWREHEAHNSQGPEEHHHQAQSWRGPEQFHLHGSEPLQGEQRKPVTQEMGNPQDLYLHEEMVLETTHHQREPELSQLQSPPLCGILWRKSKSLELRRLPDIQSQGLSHTSVQSQYSQYVDAKALAPQDQKQEDDFVSQQLQSHEAEEPCVEKQEALQIQGMDQKGGRSTGLQNMEEMQTVLPKKGQKVEIHQSQETQLEKLSSPDLVESSKLHPHEKQEPEMPDVLEAKTQAETPQESRQIATPPLLWRVLWQKAKSFELGRSCILPSPKLELALVHERLQKDPDVPQFPQKMKEASLVQLQDKSQVDPETQTPQDLRQTKMCSNHGETQEEKVTQFVKKYQDLSKSGIHLYYVMEPSNISTLGKNQTLQPQEIRELESPAIQNDPQRRPCMSQRQRFPQGEMELTSHLGTSMEGERRELELPERRSLEKLQTQDIIPEKDMCAYEPEEVRSPESPPPLWAASGMKSKSFELMKSHASEVQDLRRSQIVQSPKKLQINLEDKEPCQSKDQNVISSQELSKPGALQVQAEKEILKDEKTLSVNLQGIVSQKEIPHAHESETLKHSLLQEKEDLLDEGKIETGSPRDQGNPQINISEIPQNIPELLEDPEPVFQELDTPHALQPYGRECHEIVLPQEKDSPSKIVLHHEDHRSPETPPLLWGILELKAKSFELQKPKTFQTQDMRNMEPTFLAQRVSQKGSQAPQIHSLQGLHKGEPHMEPGTPETQAYGDPKILSPPEPREQEAHQVQIEEQSSHELKSSGSQEEYGVKIPQNQHNLPKESKVVPATQCQQLGGLETLEDQISQQRSLVVSQSHPIHQQEFEGPQTFHLYKGKTSNSSQLQPPPETEKGFPQPYERKSPETPPLLWWSLERAQQGMLHREWLTPFQEEAPATQPQAGLEVDSTNTKDPMEQKMAFSQGLEEPQVERGIFQDEAMRSTGALLFSKERRDPKSPQFQEQAPPVESVGSGLSVSQTVESEVLRTVEATQRPKTKSEGLEAQALRKMQPEPVQESTQIENILQDTGRSSRKQRTLQPKQPKDLKSFLLQEIRPEIWDSNKMDHSYDQLSPKPHEKQDTQYPSLALLGSQEFLKGKPEDSGPLDESQVLSQKCMLLGNAVTLERVKLDDFMAAETQEEKDKTKSLSAPEKLIRKSKSLDLRKLQEPNSQEVRQKELYQTQKETEHNLKALQTPGDIRVKTQKRNVLEASKCEEKSGQQLVQGQIITYLFQAQGQGTESQTPPQSILRQTTESLELMEPGVTQSQELRGAVVLQPQGSPQMGSGNLLLQGNMDAKTLCLQRHCEVENCNFKMEKQGTEKHEVLQRYPWTFFIQEACEPQAALLRRSKSHEPGELSAVLLQSSRKSETSHASRRVKKYHQMFESQGLEISENCLSHHEATEMLRTSLQDLKALGNEAQSPRQKGESGLESSAPQKRGSGSENIMLKIKKLEGQEETLTLQTMGTPLVKHGLVQVLGSMQTNTESCVSLESTDSKKKCALQTQEALVKESESLDSMKHGMPPTQGPLASVELKALPSWWILGKSKSLDSGKFHALQSTPLGRYRDSPDRQNISKISRRASEKKLQDGLQEPQEINLPTVLHSKSLPLKEVTQRDQMGSQIQDEKGLELQRTPQIESEPVKVQEPLGNEGQVLGFQKDKDTQMFSPKESEEMKDLHLQEYNLSAGECPPMQGHTQNEQEYQELVETEILNPQEMRHLQSPPLLRNLLRKSKTIILEFPTRGDVCHIQHVSKLKSLQGQIALPLGPQFPQQYVEQESKGIEELSKHDVLQHQEILEHPHSQSLVQKVEDKTIKTHKSLCVSQDFFQNQKSKSCPHPPDNWPQALPAHDVPQFGIKLLQELGKLHNEHEALRPQQLGDEEGPHPQRTRGLTGSEVPRATEHLGTTSLQIPQDQGWRSVESHHSPLVGQKVSEVHRTELQKQRNLHPPQKTQIYFQPTEVQRRESDGSTGFPILKTPGIVEPLEYLPKTSPLFPVVVDPTQESMYQVNGKPLKGEGTGLSAFQEEMHEAWLKKSKSLEPQEPSWRAQDAQCQDLKGAAEGILSWERELGILQWTTSQGPAQRQADTLGLQEACNKGERKSPGICLLHNQETSHPPEVRPIKLFPGEWEHQKEVETMEVEHQSEPPGGKCTDGRLPLKTPLTLVVSPLNLENHELGAISRRQETSSPWEKEATETWKPSALTMFSPPSPGSHSEETQWELEALHTGRARKASIGVDEGGRQSQLSQRDISTRRRKAHRSHCSGRGERADQNLSTPPRPPCREKAFIWFSHQEKEEAIQRLTELQAEGDRRHWHDKERQMMRFQERLSIARRRKSEEDLLGSSPCEQWRFPAAHPGQDQAGQKMAVKHHLEKVKRERTCIMQSKREGNTLRFKELLNPLVAPQEQNPKPGEPADL